MENPKIETRLEVKTEAGQVAELYLYGTIRKAYPWEDDTDCLSSKGVLNMLAQLAGQDVNVHINSNGGDCFESIAICNLLKQHKGAVNVYIDSMAGSGASIIATAGKSVFMYANCLQLIHKGWSVIAGNADELRKEADGLDKIDAAQRASYMSKFVGTEDELTKLMVDANPLTAAECLAFGLCSEILADVPVADPPPAVAPDGNEPQASIKASLFAKYHKPAAEISPPAVVDVPPAHLFNAFIK